MDRTDRTRILSMAVAAVAGLGLTVTAYAQTAGQQQQPDRTQQQDRMQDRTGAQAQGQAPRLPAGVEAKEGEPDTEGVQKLLRNIANAALTEGGWDDIGERLVDQDRNRWGANKPENHDQLNAAAEKFKAAYKQKYGEDFDMADGDETFTGIQVVQGEVKDPQQVAANWPVRQAGMSGRMDDQARTAGAAGGGDDATGAAGGDKTSEDGNIDEGREVAVAHLTRAAGAMSPPSGQAQPAGGQAQGGMSGAAQGLTLSFVNEFPGVWKLDVPNKVEGQPTYAKLADKLSKLADSPQTWPADMRQTQQLVAHEVLACLYGVDAGAKPAMGQDRMNGGAPGGAPGNAPGGMR